jgi:putative transposase
MDFSKWINNEFILNNPDFHWIKEVSSKSVKQSIMNAERAFKNFLKENQDFQSSRRKQNQV